MNLPFGKAEFLGAFVRYNEAVWPMQLVFYALAVAALFVVAARLRHADRTMSAVLALLWAWMGIAYHGIYFREVNPAALLFTALSLAGAATFAWAGIVRCNLRFAGAPPGAVATGLALVVYALVLYPLFSTYPASPTFGLPCPTAIFTLGVLLFLRPPYPRAVFIAPLLWALIGTQAAFLFQLYEDLGLLVAGVAGLWAAFQPFRAARQA